MNIRKFIFQNENDEQIICNIITIVNIEKTNSLYLIYTEDNNQNELLFAKIDNTGEELFLENITNEEEIKEIEKNLNERMKSYE